MCREAQGGKLDSAFALARYSFQHKPSLTKVPASPSREQVARFVPRLNRTLAM
jgi:hypothetical protein